MSVFTRTSTDGTGNMFLAVGWSIAREVVGFRINYALIFVLVLDGGTSFIFQLASSAPCRV